MYLTFTCKTKPHVTDPALLTKTTAALVEAETQPVCHKACRMMLCLLRRSCWWRRIGEVGQKLKQCYFCAKERCADNRGAVVTAQLTNKQGVLLLLLLNCTSCPVSPCSSSASTSCSFCMVCFTRAKRERLHLMEPATGGMFLVSGGASCKQSIQQL